MIDLSYLFHIEKYIEILLNFIRVTKPVVNRFAVYILSIFSDTRKKTTACFKNVEF